MFRKFLGSFTATHATVIFVAALAAPTTLFAVTYSNVSVFDPVTGRNAAVDAGRRLYTYDPVAGFTSNPAYLVNVTFYADNTTSGSTIYTVPAGKVLIVKTFAWSYYGGTEGRNNFLYLNSSGKDLMNFEGLHIAGNDSTNFSAGVVVRAGDITTTYGDGGGGAVAMGYLQGYLLPAAAVPAAATPEAAAQFVNVPAAAGKSQFR